MAKLNKSKTQTGAAKKSGGFKKTLLRGVLIFFVALIVIVIVLMLSLGSVIQFSIGKYGSEILNTDVQVQHVSMSLLGGSAAINGLTVANPRGFDTSKNALSLGEVSSKINVPSIIRDVKVIDDIVIDKLQILVEINANNAINLNEIKKNLPETQTAPTPKPETESSTKMIIRHIRFSDGKIMAVAKNLDKEYELKLPSFEMKNLGGTSGATPPEIAKQVLAEISNRALGQVKQKGLQQGTELLTNSAKALIEKERQNSKKKLMNILKK
jgi:hypothetical protein